MVSDIFIKGWRYSRLAIFISSRFFNQGFGKLIGTSIRLQRNNIETIIIIIITIIIIILVIIIRSVMYSRGLNIKI